MEVVDYPQADYMCRIYGYECWFYNMGHSWTVTTVSPLGTLRDYHGYADAELALAAMQRVLSPDTYEVN